MNARLNLFDGSMLNKWCCHIEYSLGNQFLQMYLFCQKLRLAHPDLDAPQFNFIYDVMAAD